MYEAQNFLGPIWTDTQVGNLSSRGESINLSIYHQSMNPSMYQSIHLSIYLSVNHLIYPMRYLSMCLSIDPWNPCIYLSTLFYPILSCNPILFHPILSCPDLSYIYMYIYIISLPLFLYLPFIYLVYLYLSSLLVY